MASRSADCVLGMARLTSSTSRTLAKTGPGWKTNSRDFGSKMERPVTTVGCRSGVPWMRETDAPPMERASARARIVLAVPGMSSRSTCPPEIIVAITRRISSGLPWTTGSTLTASRPASSIARSRRSSLAGARSWPITVKLYSIATRGSCLVLLVVVVAAATPAAASPGSTTFASARAAAVATLLRVYGSGGSWRLCDRPGCPAATTDWGVDSLTYALYLDWQTTRDPRVPRAMSALLRSAPVYGAPCTVPGCQSWSDVPEWDAIAALREYAVLHDPRALANAEKAYAFVQDGDAFARGACPDIDYQQPAGGANKLKTLETDANAIKAGLLLYGATHDARYLDQSEARYVAVRAPFLEPD